MKGWPKILEICIFSVFTGVSSDMDNQVERHRDTGMEAGGLNGFLGLGFVWRLVRNEGILNPKP